MTRYRVARSYLSISTVLLAAFTSGNVYAALYVGQPLRDALVELNQQEINLIFSSEVVSASMKVLSTPTTEEPLDVAREILAAHRLELLAGPSDLWMVVRTSDENPDRTVLLVGQIVDADTGVPIYDAQISSSTETVGVDNHGQFSLELTLPAEVQISAVDYETVSQRVTADQPLQLVLKRNDEPFRDIVVTGRYLLFSNNSAAEFDHEEVKQLPHLADDVMRAVGRLPAVSSNDFSAGFNVRGGTRDETALRLDGLDLIDPFHLKDLNNLFSIVDSNLVDSVEVLAGGFPAQFGDRASGVVDINTLPPPNQTVHSVGVSFINAFANSRGALKSGRGGWLVSYRRGYLDWLLGFVDTESSELSPSYSDVLAKFEHDIGDRHVASVHVLTSHDDFFLLDDSQKTRQSGKSDSLFTWLRTRSQWTDQLHSEVIVWRSAVDSIRDTQVENVEIEDSRGVSGDLHDNRDISMVGIRNDWQWQSSNTSLLSFGFDYRDREVSYDYQLSAMQESVLFPNQSDINRQTMQLVSGESYGVYASLRRKFGPITTDLGLRWDAERYTGLDESIVSPRFGLNYELNDRTSIMASWGEYNQFQPAESLQVEDGVNSFFPATRSQHTVLGIEHRATNSTTFNAEVYRKYYQRVRPRYTNLFDIYYPIPEAEPDRVLVDAGSALAQGLELTVKHRSDRRLSWWASYSYSNVVDRISGVDVPREWDQRHAVNVISNWRGDKWNFNVAAAWRTGWPRTNANLDTVITPMGPQLGLVLEERNSSRYSDYFRVDARVSRSVFFERSKITYFLEMYNIFDTENTCCVYSYEIAPGPSLNVDEDRWIPRLVSFGFAWTF